MVDMPWNQTKKTNISLFLKRYAVWINVTMHSMLNKPVIINFSYFENDSFFFNLHFNTVFIHNCFHTEFRLDSYVVTPMNEYTPKTFFLVIKYIFFFNTPQKRIVLCSIKNIRLKRILLGIMYDQNPHH